MLDWNDLRHVLAIHRKGTLARAARSLAIDPTTVGRRLAALEAQIGAKLFDRTPEGFVTTAAGRELLRHAERMEGEALALERSLAGRDQRAAGTVVVSATEMLATRFIAPHLGRFAKKNPDVVVLLQCTNRNVSLSRREADVALRLARPEEENVVVKKLTDIPLALYASPRYLEANGAPEDPDETLAGHAVLLFADVPPFAQENAWLVPRAEGARVPFRSDSVSSIYSAAVGGVGLALLPRAAADGDPGLVRVPTRTAPAPRVIWQAVHRDLVRNARVRVVLEFLGRVLGGLWGGWGVGVNVALRVVGAGGWTGLRGVDGGMSVAAPW